jgi:hypothetical protein
MLSCICTIASMIDRNFLEAAVIIDRIADCVFFSTIGCQIAQVNNEVAYQKKSVNADGGGTASNPQHHAHGGMPTAHATPVTDDYYKHNK